MDLTQIPSRLARYKDPRVIGPGVWYSLHLLAEEAVKTGNLRDFNLAYLYTVKIKDNFACITCRNNIQAYDKENPLENFKPLFDADGKMTKKQDSQGLALWIYDLHRNANTHAEQHLGPGKKKHNEDYGDVMRFFRNDGVCEEANCEGENEDIPPQDLQESVVFTASHSHGQHSHPPHSHSDFDKGSPSKDGDHNGMEGKIHSRLPQFNQGVAASLPMPTSDLSSTAGNVVIPGSIETAFVQPSPNAKDPPIPGMLPVTADQSLGGTHHHYLHQLQKAQAKSGDMAPQLPIPGGHPHGVHHSNVNPLVPNLQRYVKQSNIGSGIHLIQAGNLK